ncbi:hypothetical protein Patl1_31023 [Pistacia atlantica]|uniref:Uncharacterized protein n=1 Tax=Pistacia atlantica TaxID=434234 RepID=A0ACC1ABR8_9ROSI|nr:hypothetical protein Patl1_31023 [Pistacia atlantica]
MIEVGRIKQKRGYKDQWPWNIKIYTDEKGNNKGDAVLSYEDPAAAHAAGGFFQDHELRGHKISVVMAEKTALRHDHGALAAVVVVVEVAMAMVETGATTTEMVEVQGQIDITMGETVLVRTERISALSILCTKNSGLRDFNNVPFTRLFFNWRLRGRGKWIIKLLAAKVDFARLSARSCGIDTSGMSHYMVKLPWACAPQLQGVYPPISSKKCLPQSSFIKSPFFALKLITEGSLICFTSSINRLVFTKSLKILSCFIFGRFDDGTIQILQSLLVCKDVKSLIEVRSSLREFLRSESISIIREIAEKTLEQKLLILEFFVRAFAVIGDIESCLALRYEALLMRDLKCTSCSWLQVSYTEWLNLAEHSLENGFHAIAIKACENAQSCLQRNDIVDLNTDEMFEYVQATEKTKRLKDCAVTSVASLSVQARATEYLKKKTIGNRTKHSSYCKGTKPTASTLFRNGIKRQNVKKLLEFQGLQQITGGSDSIQL